MKLFLFFRVMLCTRPLFPRCNTCATAIKGESRLFHHAGNYCQFPIDYAISHPLWNRNLLTEPIMRGRVSDSIPSPSNHRLFRANRLFIDLCLIIGGLRIFYINITSVDDISMRESNQTEGKLECKYFHNYIYFSNQNFSNFYSNWKSILQEYSIIIVCILKKYE